MTKHVAPWNLKPGQKLLQIGLHGERRFNEILSIRKSRGYFTGKSIWEVKTNDLLFPNSSFHAARGGLKLQKAEILIEKKKKE